MRDASEASKEAEDACYPYCQRERMLINVLVIHAIPQRVFCQVASAPIDL